MKCLNPCLSLIAHLKSWRRLRKPESHLTWATEKITTKDAPDVPRKQKQLQKKEPPKPCKHTQELTSSESGIHRSTM